MKKKSPKSVVGILKRGTLVEITDPAEQAELDRRAGARRKRRWRRDGRMRERGGLGSGSDGKTEAPSPTSFHARARSRNVTLSRVGDLWRPANQHEFCATARPGGEPTRSYNMGRTPNFWSRAERTRRVGSRPVPSERPFPSAHQRRMRRARRSNSPAKVARPLSRSKCPLTSPIWASTPVAKSALSLALASTNSCKHGLG